MGKVPEYVAVAVLFVTAIGIVLETAGQFVDSEDQAKVKTKVEEFWFFVADLSTRQIVGESIKLRRQRMKRKYIPLFLILYWLLLLLIISSVLYVNLSANIDAVRSPFEQAISNDFTGRRLIIYDTIVDNISKSCAKGYQTCHTEPIALDQLARLTTQEDAYNKLVYDLSEQNPNLLRLISTASAMFSVGVVAIPLTVSLILSFNFTLFILSIITKSNYWLFLIVICDLFVALTFPPLILTLFLYAGTIISLQFINPIMDYTAFGNASITSLTIATAGVTSLLPVTLSGTALLVGYIVVSRSSIINGLFLIVNLIYHAVYWKIVAFFDDSWRVLHFDFNIDVVDSAINWAIFTDFLYSLLFLLPALAIVVIQRWPFGRRMFLNLVLWVAAHPRGVIFAFGELLLSFIIATRQLIYGTRE
jgi:hypothetical protein